jgi:hypothetical protein
MKERRELTLQTADIQHSGKTLPCQAAYSYHNHGHSEQGRIERENHSSVFSNDRGGTV